MITPEEPNPLPHQHILNIVMGFWQSRCLAVATELDLAEQLAAGPLPVDVLAARTATGFPLALPSPAGVGKHRGISASLARGFRQHARE